MALPAQPTPASIPCPPARTMKLRLLAVAAVATSLIATSCLQHEDPANAAKQQELEAKVAKLESQVTGLKTQLAAADTAKTTAESALAKATSETQRAVADASKKSAADLAATAKELATLKTSSHQADEANKSQIADLQRQIKAMALKIPTPDAPVPAAQPPSRKPVAPANPSVESSIERHISPGR